MRSPTRRRLWRGAIAVALFVATSAVCLVFITPGFDACRKAFGRDFLAFYAAGTLVRDGRAADLYDLDAVRRLQHDTARTAGFDLGGAAAPWWNPPLFAWAFAPLADLPYGTALPVWTAINLAAAGAAVWLLARIAAPAGGADRLLVALLVLASAPLLQSITHGQNSAISLLLVTATVVAWRSDKSFLAGACVGVLAYKPQLAAVLAAVLVLHRGRRAAAGVASVGAVVLLLTLVAMPGALSDYLRRLPQNLEAMQVGQTYLWERHVTLKGFWRLLIQGRGPGETTALVTALTLACAIPLLAGLPFAAIRARTQNTTDAVAAAALASAPLLMPFYFDYDLLLLAVAAVLAAPVGRRSFTTWAALYLWLFINPYVAGALRVNLTVPLLFGLALSLVDRALHNRQNVDRIETPYETPEPLARAA